MPRLIGHHEDFLIVGGLAGSAKDVHALTGGTPTAFLFAGAMGGAVSTGLGLALAQPERRVLVVTGDGELLMNVGALATVAVMAPPRLAIVCVDNELYGETGNQPTHTGQGTDLATIARGCGIPDCRTAASADEIDRASSALRSNDGPVFVHLKVSGAPSPKTERPRSLDAADRALAFRRALGLE